METRFEFRLFGILIFSITRQHAVISAEVKETLYQDFSTRFGSEMREALTRVQNP